MRRDGAKAALLAVPNLRWDEDVTGFILERRGTVATANPFSGGSVLCLAKDAPQPCTAHYRRERWRLSSGGGIAGNSGAWWLAPLDRRDGAPIGPFTSQRTLARALRAWRRWRSVVQEPARRVADEHSEGGEKR